MEEQLALQLETLNATPTLFKEVNNCRVDQVILQTTVIWIFLRQRAKRTCHLKISKNHLKKEDLENKERNLNRLIRQFSISWRVLLTTSMATTSSG